MFSYDHLQSEQYPGTETRLRIYNPSDFSYQCEVQAIVDSGAVMSCIPKSVIDKLGENLEYSVVKAKAYDNSSQKIEKKLVRLTIFNNQGKPEYDQEIFVLAVPGKKYGLIGRDILNQSKVVLNGTQEKWRLNCTGRCD